MWSGRHGGATPWVRGCRGWTLLYLVAPRRDVAGVWAGDGVLDRLATPPRAGHVLVFLRRRDVRGLTTTPPPVVLLGVRCGIFLFHGPTPNGCPLPIHVGGAHVTSRSAKSGECRELGRPTAMTHYGWVSNLGRWSYEQSCPPFLKQRPRTGGPSVVDTCLWQSLSLTEGTRSISLRARRILPLGVRPAITIQA